MIMRSIIAILLCGSLIGCAAEQGQQVVVQEQPREKTIIRVSDCPGYVENRQQRQATPINLAECRDYFDNNLSVPGEDSQVLARLGEKEIPVDEKESFNKGDDLASVDEPDKAIKQGLEGGESYVSRITKGDRRIRQGDLSGAIDEYAQAIRIDRDRAEAYFKMGKVLLEQDEYQAAIHKFEEALEKDPVAEEEYEIYFHKGIANSNLGDHQSAINDYNEAIKRFDLAEAYFNRGVAKSNLGQLDEAIDDFTLAINQDPELKSAYVKRGDANMELDNAKDAIKDFEKVTEMSPGGESLSVYFKLSEANERVKQQEDGFEIYDQEFNEYPKLAAEYIERGNVKLNEKDYSGAIYDYDEAMGNDPSREEGYEIVMNRGFAKSELGELENALEDYDQAIIIFSDIATAYIKRGHVKFKKGDYTGADEDYERAMNSNPFEGERYEIHLYRGRIDFKEGRTRLAIGKFNIAIELAIKLGKMGEHRPEAYNDRGLAKLSLFEKENNNDVELKWEINADFKAAIKAAKAGGLDQDQYVAEAYNGYINSGKLKLRVAPDRIEDAIDDFDLAIELDDTRPEAFINRGDAMLLRDEPAAAIKDYGQAIATETEQVFIEAYLKRGKAYLILQDHLSAIDNYDIVISSGHALVHELIEALFSRGLAMSERGSYWDAIDDLDDAINQLKSAADKHAQQQYISHIYLPLHYYRGIARLQLGQPEDALLDFGRAKTEYYERESSQTANGDESHVRVQLPDILTQEGNAYKVQNKPKKAEEAFAHAYALKIESDQLEQGSSTSVQDSSALIQERESSIIDSLSSFAFDIWLFLAE